MAPTATVPYKVVRDGRLLDVTGPHPYPPFADVVQPQSAALAQGMRAGDVITAVDGRSVASFGEVQIAVAAAAGTPLTFTIWRDGRVFDKTIAPKVTDIPNPNGGFDQRWLVGIAGGLFFEPVTEPLGFGRAVRTAVERTWLIIEASVSGLWHIITGAISTCNLSGPITIAETSGQVAAMGTMSFLAFIALLSTAIGLMNLFPIPMLDGGHLVLYAYEAVAGRPPNAKVVQLLFSVGFGNGGGLDDLCLGQRHFLPVGLCPDPLAKIAHRATRQDWARMVQDCKGRICFGFQKQSSAPQRRLGRNR